MTHIYESTTPPSHLCFTPTATCLHSCMCHERTTTHRGYMHPGCVLERCMAHELGHNLDAHTSWWPWQNILPLSMRRRGNLPDVNKNIFICVLGTVEHLVEHHVGKIEIFGWTTLKSFLSLSKNIHVGYSRIKHYSDARYNFLYFLLVGARH